MDHARDFFLLFGNDILFDFILSANVLCYILPK